MFRILILLFLSMGLFGQTVRSADVEVNDRYKAYFEAQGVKGSFALHDLNRDKCIVYDPDRCKTGFLPASTFKIFNALVGLETGVLRDKDHVIPWDGTRRQFPVWNKDHTLKSAMKYSAVWYFQEVARRIGPDRMKKFLKEADYGANGISAGIDCFWLEGDFSVSPLGQIEFLKKLYLGTLPFSRRSMEIVKEILINESSRGYVLRAKTGLAMRVSPNIGWWIGWVEQNGNAYFFATNIEGDAKKNPKFAKARIAITREIFRDLGLARQRSTDKPFGGR